MQVISKEKVRFVIVIAILFFSSNGLLVPSVSIFVSFLALRQKHGFSSKEKRVSSASPSSSSSCPKVECCCISPKLHKLQASQ